MRVVRLLKELVSWFILTFFVFLITLNFYVNVWEQKGDERFYENSKYFWISKPNSEVNGTMSGLDFQDFVLSDNVTIRNYLERPLTVRETTTPSPRKKIIWRDLKHFDDDRILAQMEYKPDGIIERERNGEDIPVKSILLYNGYKDWGVKPGRQTFIDQNCPVNACALTDSRRQGSSADAVLFRQTPTFPWYKRPPGQLWILYLLEAPYFTPSLRRFNGHFNLTASYRHDSDIVAPYEKFVRYDSEALRLRAKTSRNYAAGKTKKVAWFVSNCKATNTRMEYAKQLSKYIQVDIFGKCGNMTCTRGKESCSDLLNKEYKFYLAFENSNCRDYITEKFFYTGLQHDVIPIVMGAAPEDYRRAAPHYSFIHVDEYTSPKQLANYLHQLDDNDDHYNEYFKWKGTGEFINTFFWCRVCALLHDTTSREMTPYGDVNRWWRGRDVCIGKHRWGEHPNRGPYISDFYSNA